MDRFEPPWLGRRRGWLVAHPAGARRRAVLDGGDAADVGARRVRAARRPGRVRCRRRRTSSSTPTAPTCCRRRARPRLVADRARLPAGDDPLGRHRLHLGRPAPGRRLDLARGLPRDGAVHGRRRGVLGAARCRAWSARRGRRASRATTCSASSPSPRRSRVGFVVTRYALRAAGARALLAPLLAAQRRRRGRCAERWADLVALFAGIALDAAAGRLGGAAGPLRDLARRPARATSRRPGAAAVPRLHRPLQARRRVRRLAADAVPAPGDGTTARPRSASSTR